MWQAFGKLNVWLMWQAFGKLNVWLMWQAVGKLNVWLMWQAFGKLNACVTNMTVRQLGKPHKGKKNWLHFSICACHPCAGAMLIFSVSFQF